MRDPTATKGPTRTFPFPSFLMMFLALLSFRSSAGVAAFLARQSPASKAVRLSRRRTFSASSSTETGLAVKQGISRLETLQSLLGMYGAPGSSSPAGVRDDWEPAPSSFVPSLHPHLYPICKSKSTGNYICGLRRAFANDQSNYESSSNAPWPLVESAPGLPGMKLLALNSEHYMRRIAAEVDFSNEFPEVLQVYNSGLGEGLLANKALDQLYEPGSVDKLGYGAEKYVLLKVGPFPDLYQTMSMGHKERKDEQSCLIAAEAANSKFGGFASTFLFYAQILSQFPNRSEEARDAARMCLRMPLPSIGMSKADFKEVAVLGQLAEEGESDDEALAKLQAFYERIRQQEQDDQSAATTAADIKSPEQEAIDEANILLDRAALSADGSNWEEIRSEVAAVYHNVGREDMARFVDPVGGSNDFTLQ